MILFVALYPTSEAYNSVKHTRFGFYLLTVWAKRFFFDVWEISNVDNFECYFVTSNRIFESLKLWKLHFKFLLFLLAIFGLDISDVVIPILLCQINIQWQSYITLSNLKPWNIKTFLQIFAVCLCLLNLTFPMLTFEMLTFPMLPFQNEMYSFKIRNVPFSNTKKVLISNTQKCPFEIRKSGIFKKDKPVFFKYKKCLFFKYENVPFENFEVFKYKKYAIFKYEKLTVFKYE